MATMMAELEAQVESRGADQTGGEKIPVTVAYGDGIGPEIMQAVLHVLEQAGAPLSFERIEVGESVYLRGVSSGLDEEAWDSIRRNRVLLKAPITTPQGGGYKSLNVTLRKSLGLFANVRPCTAYAPFVRTLHPSMNLVIVRENEEDLYGGIEHQQTDEVVQCLKLVSRPGCERIIRHAFEFARRNGRRKVTCMTKDNIMKLTDGLFHRTFDAVAKEYPEILSEHMIIDIGAARLADTPEIFDVIVTLNLYGDILSDIAAQVAGSVGLAPSANIGREAAMFEAIHGSAPQIAGQDVANPSGLLLSAVMMLVHLGLPEYAERIHNAWLRTIEDGVHTGDIYSPETSSELVGTQAFAAAVAARLGQRPTRLAAVRYVQAEETADARAMAAEVLPEQEPMRRELTGVDVFLYSRERDAEEIAQRLTAETADSALGLTMITNRGVKVWPKGLPETFCTDHWRCRFEWRNGAERNGGHLAIAGLLTKLAQAGLESIKTENLYTLDGRPGYSLGQGQ